MSFESLAHVSRITGIPITKKWQSAGYGAGFGMKSAPNADKSGSGSTASAETMLGAISGQGLPMFEDKKRGQFPQNEEDQARYFGHVAFAQFMVQRLLWGNMFQDDGSTVCLN